MMNVDVASFLIGIFSSIAVAVSVYLTNKTAKKYLEKRSIVLRNINGDTIELTPNNSEKDSLRLLLHEAIIYENSVADLLKKLGVNFEQPSRHEVSSNYDYLIKSGNQSIAVEVKSFSKPLTSSKLKEIVRKLPEASDKVLLISKSGFSESSIEYIKKFDSRILLASGEGDTLQDQVQEALKCSGIVP